MFVRGEDPPCVMDQLGHTVPAFTLRVNAHAMRRDKRDRERLSPPSRAVIGHYSVKSQDVV